VRTSLLVAALLVHLGFPAALAAQAEPASARLSITGQVLDRASREPIAEAIITVQGEGRQAATDENGRFRLEVRAGDYLVSVKRLGYTELLSPLSFSQTTGRVTFMLDAQAELLEAVTVTYDHLERRRQTSTRSSHVMNRSSVVLAQGHGNLADVIVRSPFFVRAPGCRVEHCALFRGAAVPPTVYVDEVLVTGGMSGLGAYSPAEVERIEIYSRGSMVRVYTSRYIESVARRRAHLGPATHFE
jgi:hypothetical protein